MYHIPVLLNESVNALNIKPDGIYVDVTFGGGGHSRRILECLGENGRLYAFDQDEDAAKNVIDDRRFTFIQQNFRYMKNFLQLYCGGKVDGILADLGVSSYQFDTPEKGFSIRYNGRLDMRMNKNAAVDAANIVNTYDVTTLASVLSRYGELRNAMAIADAVAMAREVKPIETTDELKEAVSRFLPRGSENKVLAQIFQALRIEVNEEMKVLELFLGQCADVLNPGGRLVVLSYHSLEDRLVKNFMKTGNADGNLEKDFFGNQLTPYKLLSSKPIVPSDDEIQINNRARSAKLRVAERRSQ
ncbi:MAG: 16S rRNA (cytosine(1402)-N(4))-methyltransferase RsmH [Bacteroidales bacterium]|nr:16S rRNA (cytosine(1402)-N(4))-methyltransferase RsmH [Bacteroidales bacterium]MBR3914546.1 16S rRNA (cytosine(1402)-N(4))-methyltransferase RsmH [Bacteroidales bacterium]